MPAVAPYCCCEDNGVELLPLDAPFPLGGAPAAVEPLPIAVGSEASGPRAVSKELQVGGGGPVWEEEEGATIPGGGKVLPPLEVELERARNVDCVLGGGNGAAEVDHPSEEGPACWNNLRSKAQGADEGEEFPL